MRRRNFLRAIAAVPVGVAAALGVRAEAEAVEAVAEQWTVSTGYPEARLAAPLGTVVTFSSGVTAPRWAPPPLTTEQQSALTAYHAEQSEPLEVLHSAERPLRWERHADGWHSIWTD